MKIVDNELVILRDYIERKLKLVPNGERIRIKKGLLERLLFSYNYDKIHRVEYKIPIWSGKFLSKIDLSDVDFSLVSWSIGNRCNNEEFVDYSNTNANIDFNNSYEVKTNNYVILKKCNFRGTDLSHNHLDKLFAYDTDLSNTSLFLENTESLFENCNLSNLNLSNICIKLPYDATDRGNFEFSSDCNLSNTGINISLIYLDVLKEKNDVKEKLYWMIKNDYLNGCYINNVLINQNIGMQRISEILYLNHELFRYLSSDINEQIRLIKRKNKNALE